MSRSINVHCKSLSSNQVMMCISGALPSSPACRRVFEITLTCLVFRVGFGEGRKGNEKFRLEKTGVLILLDRCDSLSKKIASSKVSIFQKRYPDFKYLVGLAIRTEIC